MAFGIDISENVVRIVKTTAKGVIVRAGEAEFVTVHEPGSKEYILDLANAVHYAAKMARVTGGAGTTCNVVAGGPEVVVRRFTWPEMPPLALQENARMEFAPFLPGEASDFSIGFEVVNRTQDEETSSVTVDVMVAALPKVMVDSIEQAVRRAGFKASRIDVRENSRVRLVNSCCIVADEGAPESYAILDFSQNRANLGLYLNGMFYSNRYFVASTPVEEEDDPYSHYEEEDEDSEPKEKVITYRYDPITLANDILSIIDYMQYRERGSSLACIFLIGEEKVPGIEESLADSLDIPIFSTHEWLKGGIVGSLPGRSYLHIASFLDAYGVSLPVNDPKNTLHLAGAIRPSILKKTVLPLLIPGVIVATIVAATILIMNPRIRRLENELADIERHMAANPITITQFTQMQTHVNRLTTQISNMEDFETEWPHAIDIMPLLFDPTIERRLQRPLHLTGFVISDGQGTLAGAAIDFEHVADAVDAMLDHEWIRHTTTMGALDPSREVLNLANVMFAMPLELERGVGLRNANN